MIIAEITASNCELATFFYFTAMTRAFFYGNWDERNKNETKRIEKGSRLISFFFKLVSFIRTGTINRKFQFTCSSDTSHNLRDNTAANYLWIVRNEWMRWEGPWVIENTYFKLDEICVWLMNLWECSHFHSLPCVTC